MLKDYKVGYFYKVKNFFLDEWISNKIYKDTVYICFNIIEF